MPIAGFQAQSFSAPPASAQGGNTTIATAAGGDALNDRLNAGDDQETAVATMLPDRNLFLTMGTPMPCITEQPIRTDVPGPFRCKVPTPVYSTSGAVPLLDPGTWIVGRVSEPLGRGMERAFAVVTRLETPPGTYKVGSEAEQIDLAAVGFGVAAGGVELAPEGPGAAGADCRPGRRRGGRPRPPPPPAP